MTNTSSYNGATATEDNRPGGWANDFWSAAPTPSGHANINLNNGNLNDKPDANNNYVAAVL